MTPVVALAAGLALGAGGLMAVSPLTADAGAPAKKVIHSEDAPAAIGPYSQGIRAGQTIYVSGQLPIDPEVGDIDPSHGITEQTNLSIENIKAVLAAENIDLDHVVMSNVYLADMDDFAAFNEEYARHFGEDAAPARATVEVARLPKDALVEISVIAIK
ncbi:Rid family detoxifying hydrolase [Ornithinimicrobium cavernae]|uniref:Rid family detoxifying hydrolase n=1 Tax=Ornithinimicrobium cavernae TaxID=2666047 RepID=UPI001F004975|nr:Rid family detoxifying hydrolase [Ornithinimicrobium cavernae]